MYFRIFEDFAKDSRYYRDVAKWWDAMSEEEHWKILDHLGKDLESYNTLRIYGGQKYGIQQKAGKLGIQELYANRGKFLGKDLGISESTFHNDILIYFCNDQKFFDGSKYYDAKNFFQPGETNIRIKDLLYKHIHGYVYCVDCNLDIGVKSLPVVLKDAILTVQRVLQIMGEPYASERTGEVYGRQFAWSSWTDLAKNNEESEKLEQAREKARKLYHSMRGELLAKDLNL